MTYRGRVQNGVVVLENSASLPDGTEVSVRPLKNRVPPKRRRKPLPGKGLLAFAGQAEGLPADASRNLEHYLYGHPRR